MSGGRRLQGPSTARRLISVGALLVLVVLALLPLIPVYGVGPFATAVGGALVIGGGVAALLAVRGTSGWVMAAVVAVIGTAAAVPLAAPQYATARIVPTVAGLQAVGGGVVRVWKDALTLQPPFGDQGVLLLVPYLLAIVAAAAVVWLILPARATATWRAVAAATVPLAVLVVAVIYATRSTVVPEVVGVVSVVVATLWLSWWTGKLQVRRVATLVVMLAVAVASGALVGPLVAEAQQRLVVRDQLEPPFDPRDYHSPLSSFRQYIKDWKETELFVISGLPSDVPVRLATMDAFDGVVWNVSPAGGDGSGAFRKVAEERPAVRDANPATVEITIGELPGVWLPTVGLLAEVAPVPGGQITGDDVRYNRATGTAVLPRGLQPGQSYRLQVLVPEIPADGQLTDTAVAKTRLPEPRSVPEVVAPTASDAAAGATSAITMARNIEQWLTETGWFSHGITDSGDYPSLAGHGASRVTALLSSDLMVGDGEQYASAMALMARSQGLPARVVMGFMPPKTDGEAAAEAIAVTGADISAWVEIEFDGVGWVPFYPTPPESKTPHEDTEQEQSDNQPQVVQPPPAPEEPIVDVDEDAEQPRTEDTEEELTVASDYTLVIVIVGSVLIPLIVVLTPILVLVAIKMRRRYRRRNRGSQLQRVVGGWDETVDALQDVLGLPADPLATRREIAAAVAQRGIYQIGELAAGADAVSFGTGAPSEPLVQRYWEQVDTVRAAMRATVPVRRRLRSRWTTASLRSRRAQRRAARTAARQRGKVRRP